MPIDPPGPPGEAGAAGGDVRPFDPPPAEWVTDTAAQSAVDEVRTMGGERQDPDDRGQRTRVPER